METLILVVVGLIVLFVVVTLMRSVRIVPQQRQDLVERLGRYQRTLRPGMNLLVPIVDSIRAKVDMREQVVSFPPQPVITSDNLVVSIDTVLYFKVVDPVRATYEIANFLQAIEQLTVTTLRNVIGSMDLERALTSRDEINRHLSVVLDEATGRWGIKVTRVEIKAIEPPPSIRDSMEKQMRAERDRRAAILNAEGVKQSQILTAEGDRQGQVLRAQGDREARILRAEGEAKAVRTVFEAIHAANPDPKLLAYQYLQTLPQIANGQANKVWIVPAELTKALGGIGNALGGAFTEAAIEGGEATRVATDGKAEAAAAEEVARIERTSAEQVARVEEVAQRETAAVTAPGGLPAGTRRAATQGVPDQPRGLAGGEPVAPANVLGAPAQERAKA